MNIHPTAMVDQSAEIGEGAVIEAYALVGPQVKVGAGCRIGHHASVERNTTLGENTRIWPHASLGTAPQDLKFQGEPTFLEIGAGCMIREFVTVNRGTGDGGGTTRVGEGCLLMAYSHVAHDCQLGKKVIMANAATLGGHVHVEDYASLGGIVAVHQFTRIGRNAFIGGLSGVAQDQAPYCLCEGNRCKPRAINVIGLKRAGFTPETVDALKKTFRIIFRTHTPLKEAIARVREEVPDLPEVKHVLDFIEGSERGVAR